MSNLGIAGFDKIGSEEKDGIPARKDLKIYFEENFSHEPTEDQLKIFLDFLIGREDDLEKVLDYCNNLNEGMEK